MQVNLLGFYRISEAIGGVTVCLNAAQNATTDRDAVRQRLLGHQPAEGRLGDQGRAGPGVRPAAARPAARRPRPDQAPAVLPQGRVHEDHLGRHAAQPVQAARPAQRRGPARCSSTRSSTCSSLARQFESLTSGKINFATIPNNGSQLIYPDGVETSIVEVNRAAIPAFVAALEGKGNSAYDDARPAAAASVTVDVLNGTDVARLAARNADALKAFGFRINTVDSTSTTTRTHDGRVPGGQGGAGQGPGRRTSRRPQP